MRRSTPLTEPFRIQSSVVEDALGIALIMAAMTVAASVCSGIVTLALMS